MGVAAVGGWLVAPAAFSLDDDDATAIVVRRGVRVRAEPASRATVVARVSLERVRLESSHQFEMSLFDDAESPDSPAAWALVTTSTGVTGFVYGRYLYTVDRERFFFEQVDGRWLLVSWAAGAG